MRFSEDEFDLLVTRELEAWRRTALRILHCAGDADDAVQAALTRFWQLGTAPEVRNPAGYVTVCVVHASYEILRKRIRESEKIQAYAMAESGRSRDPRLEALQLALSRLPELYRDAIQLAVLDGRSGEEAAALLGCSANTLYQRIHKAKCLLKAEMAKYGEKIR